MLSAWLGRCRRSVPVVRFAQPLYQNIIAVEKGLKEFSPYAVYELDGGLVVWSEAKKAMLQNLILQKKLLAKAVAATRIFRRSSGNRLKIGSWIDCRHVGIKSVRQKPGAFLPRYGERKFFCLTSGRKFFIADNRVYKLTKAENAPDSCGFLVICWRESGE